MSQDKHNPLNAKLLHAYDLIFALCEERITPEQFRELDALVCNDQEIRSFYIDVMALRSSLRWFAFYLRPPLPLAPFASEIKQQEVGVDQLRNSLEESMITTALTNISTDGNVDLEEIFQPPLSLRRETQHSGSGGISKNFKRSIAAGMLLAVGLIAYATFVHSAGYSPNHVAGVPGSVPGLIAPQPVAPPVLVATLNFTEKSVWPVDHIPPQDGKFYEGQLLKLESGAAQLSLQHGGRLVVEGPVEVEFSTANKFTLHQGKIAATIPGGGLVVDCPNGSVTDLGTQFGLEANVDGSTTVAVFQGRVSASLSSTATTTESNPVVLSVGQAATISPTAVSIDKKGAMPQQFIRSLLNNDITSLDVTDLICGGDGTTHRRGIGINPTNGDIGMLRPVPGSVSDGNYHPVKNYPFVDGAFIPDVARDATVINSAGDQFHFSGIGNTTNSYIFTGGTIPSSDTVAIETVLNGIDYATGNHAVILIHPNNGLTLDLNAVRRIYPGRLLKTFRCRVGISDAVKPKDTRAPNASALVFTDGAVRFQNPHFTISDGSFEVNLPLREMDRFLTLVSIYAGKGSYNRVLWVDAKLELSAER